MGQVGDHSLSIYPKYAQHTCIPPVFPEISRVYVKKRDKNAENGHNTTARTTNENFSLFLPCFGCCGFELRARIDRFENFNRRSSFLWEFFKIPHFLGWRRDMQPGILPVGSMWYWSTQQLGSASTRSLESSFQTGQIQPTSVRRSYRSFLVVSRRFFISDATEGAFNADSGVGFGRPAVGMVAVVRFSNV